MTDVEKINLDNIIARLLEGLFFFFGDDYSIRITEHRLNICRSKELVELGSCLVHFLPFCPQKSPRSLIFFDHFEPHLVFFTT